MTRRTLLLAALAPSQSPPITRIEVFPLAYPVSGYFKFFTKPERPAIFVKVTCEDGTTGWGQSVPIPTWSYETLESATHTLRNYLAPVLIGKSPTDLPAVHAAMNKAIAPSFSTGMPIAKAGLDLALHDIAGKLAKQSLPALWNRKPIPRIALSWTVNVKTIAEAETILEDGRKQGYRHFNIKVSPDPKFDLELAKTVRRFSPDCFLWADANGGYDLDTALTVIPELRDAGVNVMEQPVPPNHLTGLIAIRKQGALPIVLDEGLVNVRDLEEFHKLGCLDGAAMKPARTAGLHDARRQVEYLERNKLMFLGSGLTDPDVALAAALVLYSAYGLKYPAALNGLQFLAGSFLKTPFTLQDGAITVPTGHGLGVEVDETKVRNASHA
ncbi:MAG TPA: enolase C-terminal domain-like protein [Paludibaculum sp.]|jgi:L-alanine-DL-glutamate epimerase-like enolase superfamily enzyme